MAITKTCRWSGKEFIVTDEDLAFYEKIGVPTPTLCPEERRRRREVWRNERFLYKLNCQLCGKVMISLYPKEAPFPNYCESCFWSDKWSPLNYGRDVNFSRPFFEQLQELQNVVPRIAISHVQCENSDYSMNCMNNKNCYLLSGADYNEDCMYGINSQRSKDCIDHYLIYDSNLCYGCLDSSRLYNCIGCQNCESCTDSHFLFDCKGCKSCALSSNLRNKEYVFENQQLDKETYQTKLSERLKQIFQSSNWMQENRSAVRAAAIHRHALIVNGENVTGNYIRNAKNSELIFDAENLEDCKYVYYALDIKDSHDISCIGFKSNLLYELVSGALLHNCHFSNFPFNTSDVFYSILVWHCNNLFGCIGMHNHEQYCILNKKYSKEEYEELKAKLIAHMKETGEWGEFLPPSMSPFEYNRSMINDRMPLTREQALARGFKWYDGDDKVAEKSSDVAAMTCEICQKQYRPIAQEMKFYEKMNLPVPKFCWPCRLLKLIAAREPYELFENTCQLCGTEIQTTISKDRQEKVFCEKCYLAAVY